jgi:hypothetical protein
MFTKRYRHYTTLASLMALTNACSDDSSTAPTQGSDAGGQSSAFLSGEAGSDSNTRATTEESFSDVDSEANSSAARSDASTTSASSAEPTPTSSHDGGQSQSDPDAGSPTSLASDATETSTGDEATLDGGEPDTGEVDGGNPDHTDTADSGASEDLSDSGAVDPVAAKAFFWRAFAEQRIDDGALASQRLEAALAVNPGDANLALLVAHSYLWRLSEFGRTTNPDPSQLPALAGAAEGGFARAYAQAPDDGRILGWLGSVMIGNGGATGDEEKLNAGHSLVDQGAAIYPEFNGFVQSLVNASYPVGSPQFDLAVEAMWDNLDICAGFTTERETPNVRDAVQAVLEGEADPACANTLRAAHNLEGFFLYFGDILLKANQETAARAMYDATRASPTFDLWPYRETLIQRELDVTARLAAYTNEDPSDDPRLIAQEPFNCSYCHAASPGEALPYSLDVAP